MNFSKQFSTGRQGGDDPDAQCAGPRTDAGSLGDAELGLALRDFRSSVHAWSDAVHQRPRLVEVAPRRMAWRKAAAWALGSVLVVGGAGGGLLGYRLQQEHARIAAREAKHQRQLQEQRARQAEEELAQVDSDVSREVPAALEPLGQLMTADESR